MQRVSHTGKSTGLLLLTAQKCIGNNKSKLQGSINISQGCVVRKPHILSHITFFSHNAFTIISTLSSQFSVSVSISLATWPVSIQLCEVVQHKCEETGELSEETREIENHLRWRLHQKTTAHARTIAHAHTHTGILWKSPSVGPVHRHIQWTERCSRYTSASSPAGPCSAGTIAESELPLW